MLRDRLRELDVVTGDGVQSNVNNELATGRSGKWFRFVHITKGIVEQHIECRL